MLGDPSKTFLLSEKNVAESSFRSYQLSDHIELCACAETMGQSLVVQSLAPARTVQFFFCIKGAMEFVFQGARGYSRVLSEGSAFLMYQPARELAAEVHLSPETRGVALAIPVKALHQLFVREDEPLNFLQGEQLEQKYYSEIPVSPQGRLVLEQVLNQQHVPLHLHLYYYGKVLELLSVVFDQEKEKGKESCPFLLDSRNVERIRLAKRIVLEHMLEPPGLKDLARQVGLNVYQLKVGFKNIYGASVFQYLNDAKMEQARQQLNTLAYKVNEVSDALGYSSSSHFIAAFKRKFGITPKKYLMALQQGRQPESHV